jgi:hypothetical protein
LRATPRRLRMACRCGLDVVYYIPTYRKALRACPGDVPLLAGSACREPAGRQVVFFGLVQCIGSRSDF